MEKMDALASGRLAGAVISNEASGDANTKRKVPRRDPAPLPDREAEPSTSSSPRHEKMDAETLKRREQRRRRQPWKRLLDPAETSLPKSAHEGSRRIRTDGGRLEPLTEATTASCGLAFSVASFLRLPHCLPRHRSQVSTRSTSDGQIVV